MHMYLLISIIRWARIVMMKTMHGILKSNQFPELIILRSYPPWWLKWRDACAYYHLCILQYKPTNTDAFFMVYVTLVCWFRVQSFSISIIVSTWAHHFELIFGLLSYCRNHYWRVNSAIQHFGQDSGHNFAQHARSLAIY